MKIAIKFGDNDFIMCFYGVLEAIKSSLEWNRNTPVVGIKTPIDKEQLCKIINELSYGCYLLYQHYNDDPISDSPERIKDYLRITPKQIMIDDEVVKYLAENEIGNCGTFIFDSDLNNENEDEYPIFCK